nr:putative beta-lactamase/transpeptidase-like protein [Tanacetum cinerariifolium]
MSLLKVNHVLTHSAGLHNAFAGISDNDPDLYCNFDECLKRIAMVTPETEPGTKELYHHLSFGWLCGGIIEKYQEVLEEAFTRPVGIEGEFYVGIPTGIKESRLATLSIDAPSFKKLATFIDSQKTSDTARVPSSFTFSMLENLISSSNTLSFRRAIQPAANAHLSARALGRYYATLEDGGVVPTKTNELVPGIFTNPKDKIHDAILGRGDYNDLILPSGSFGLGFHRIFATDGSLIGFGHMGLGGATGYCDIKNRFAIAPHYVDCEKSLLRPLSPEAIVEPTKDENTKVEWAMKSQATKHDGYSALSISAAESNSIRIMTKRRGWNGDVCMDMTMTVCNGSLSLFTIIYASMPQYVDHKKSLSSTLPPAAIVEPTKDDNTKAKKSQATKHDGYSAISIS